MSLYNPLSTTLQINGKTLQKCQPICGYAYILSINIHIGIKLKNSLMPIGVIKVFRKVTALSVNEPSLPRFAFICSIGVTEPARLTRSRLWLRHLHCAVSSSYPASNALLLLCRYDVVRAANTGSYILHQNSNSLQAHLPFGCLNQPRTINRHLDRTSSGRYSDSLIFFILDDILDLLVICTPIVSPLPIANISNIEKRSFLRLVKAL